MQQVPNDIKKEPEYSLRLFITGASPNSTKAIVNLRELCDEYLGSNYNLEIIDIYQQPQLAQLEQIIALPMLIKSHPLPVRRLIGDMSNREKVLTGLGLEIDS